MLGRIGDLVGNAKVIAGTAFTEFATALDDPVVESVTLGPLTPRQDTILAALGCDSLIQVETEVTALRELVDGGTRSVLMAATVALETCGSAKLIATVDAMQETHDDEMRRFRLKYEAVTAQATAERDTLNERLSESDRRIRELEQQVEDRNRDLANMRVQYDEMEGVVKKLVEDKLRLTMEKEENCQLDGHLVRGLVVQLSACRDDPKLRLKTISVLADLLHFSEDERNRARLVNSESLAQQFLDFLQDEV